MMPAPQGWQQSDVTEHPGSKNGMQGKVVVVVETHTPVASGLLCWQTRPAAHTGGGAKMFPPQGPPSPETHPHVVPSGTGSHVAPDGQRPPHAPEASLPHGLTQRAAGPGQQAGTPLAARQMQTWTHVRFTQASWVQPFPSLQSASV